MSRSGGLAQRLLFSKAGKLYPGDDDTRWRHGGGNFRREIPELPITCGNGLINVRVCITTESSVVGQAIDDC